MRKSLVEIYALAVCFFTVACFVVVLGLASWNVVELSFPEFTIHSNIYESHLNDDKYRESLAGRNRYAEEKYVPPEGDLLTKKREESWRSEVRGEQRGALQSLAKNVIILFIDILVFLVHWVIARKSRESHS